MKNKHIYNKVAIVGIAFALFASFTPVKNLFTPAEQQQVSIATPGLFDRSQAFNVDFEIFGSKEYSFPLPVGKATLLSGNSVLKIETSKGDAVKAMFDGHVRLSRKTESQGNVIVIRHDNGLETVYANNAENLVKVGQRVEAGQTIAIVGGEKGRWALTFYVMVNGGKINPEIIVMPKSHRLTRRTLMFKKKGFAVETTVVGADKKTKEQDLAVFYPLPGAKVISPYGRRGGRSHTGVDIKTRPNDNILAAFDGVVTMSQRYAAYGNLIKIRHERGLETWYSHNSKNLVSVGDRVKAGQVIALTG